MKPLLRMRLRRFRRSEDGSSSTIEFLFWFPVFIYVCYSGMDMGLMSFSHANLERALDETIREVRLNRLPAGETEWTHDLLKDMVCDRVRHVSNCSTHLALEMKSIDPRVGNQLNTQVFCVDTPETIRNPDQVDFDRGTSNELMIIRACLKVSPVWGFTMTGGLASQDPDGQWELHATTVFVHEPFGGDTSNPITNPAATGGTSDTGGAT
ncbi:TadE/TadG family type IV pilus assembly protein [Ruegeria arenilitoris]|uniref:TadE/TadG family type IV pilus assembly protein n=1 Tax=Ruegeria arenilitoris TaxID=1173585 RepID=UPI00147B85BA|nr:TadE family protein [Ruegeria arenilitoris]